MGNANYHKKKEYNVVITYDHNHLCESKKQDATCSEIVIVLGKIFPPLQMGEGQQFKSEPGTINTSFRNLCISISQAPKEELLINVIIFLQYSNILKDGSLTSDHKRF